jgi:hypothetical protein
MSHCHATPGACFGFKHGSKDKLTEVRRLSPMKKAEGMFGKPVSSGGPASHLATSPSK